MKREPRVTKHLCPLCKWPLMIIEGDSIRPDNGYTLWCPSLKCPAQEVSGHGRTEARALEVINAKFTGASMSSESLPDEPEENSTPVIVDEPTTTGPRSNNPVKRGRGRPPKTPKVVETEEELPL